MTTAATLAKTTVFGIRHHGPGSARSLVRSLQTLTPDIILVEGPPEANDSLSLLQEAGMQPPVALLIYPPNHLQHSAYYPFAVFSPEWQAIQHGLRNNVPVRFMDLPQTHQMAERVARLEQPEPAENSESTKQQNNNLTEQERRAILDPLSLLAEAAGYTDSERWWEHTVEHRQDDTAIFQGILEAMSALRKEVEQSRASSPDYRNSKREAQREAHMRKTIRQARKEGFQNIAVVCGAWHTPALVDPLPPAKQDNAILKGLPKLKVKATWIPWTYDRLSNSSGYGAGVNSPGWYHHLWQSSQPSHSPTQSAIHWLTRVARLLRKEDLEASSASVIEAVRLAEALASIRESAMPGLAELTEATQTVLCFGDDAPLKLIHRRLIVSDRIGQVPESTPTIPLQQDLQQQQKRLRLKPEVAEKLLTLDLRKEIDLGRSHLLYRLRLLGIFWGTPQRTSGKGTFKEAWKLEWQPELSLAIIEAGRWGNTLTGAAEAFVKHEANTAQELQQLTHLLDRVLLSHLPRAIAHLMQQLQNAAAIASDVTHLMAALPPLANVLRYRDVRQTDSAMVARVVDGLVARICVGLPNACASLNDEAAGEMIGAIANTHSAIKLLQQSHHSKAWSVGLVQVCDRADMHGLIAGHSCRLLLDEGSLTGEEAANRLSLALSIANEPAQAAAWVEGFLRGSGLLLLHDNSIWQVLDSWVTNLNDDSFTALLPLLRRTFSNFPAPERRQMGERVRRGEQARQTTNSDELFEHERAVASLPLISQILGLPPVNTSS
ncbi:MAG: DUF5682 family protein [Cyanobacteria bacterium J06629_19]